MELNQIFLILTCIYIIFSNVSFYSGIFFLLAGIIFYLSYNVGKKLYDNVELKVNYSLHYKIGLILMIIGFISTILDLLWVRDIPLFNPLSRKFLSVYLTVLARFFILGWPIVLASSNIEKKKAIIYTIIFSIFVMLLGYRTTVLVLLIASIFVLYYKNQLSKKEIYLLFVIVFGIIVLLSFLRLLVLGVSGNPITSRISLTMSVYDILFNYFNGQLNGYLLYAGIFSYLGLSPGPRNYIAHLLGVSGVSITPTCVGAVVADYGTIGIISYFGILGIFLGYFYKLAKELKGVYLGLYCVLMGYTLVGIESGILDFDVILYYIVGMILCLIILLRKKLKK